MYAGAYTLSANNPQEGSRQSNYTLAKDTHTRHRSNNINTKKERLVFSNRISIVFSGIYLGIISYGNQCKCQIPKKKQKRIFQSTSQDIHF